MHEIMWNIHNFRKISIKTIIKHGTFTVKELTGCVFSLECHLVSTEEVKVTFKRLEGDDGPVEMNVVADMSIKPGVPGVWHTFKKFEGTLSRNSEVVGTFNRGKVLIPSNLPSEVLTIVLGIRRMETNEVYHPRVAEVRTCVNVKRIKTKIRVDELLKEDRANPFKHKIEDTQMYFQAKWGSGSPPELRIEFGRSKDGYGKLRCHYFTAGITLRDEYGRDQCDAEDTFLFEKNSDALWLHPFNPGQVSSKGWELFFQLVYPDGTASSQVMKTECQRVNHARAALHRSSVGRLFKRPLPWDIMLVAKTGNDGYPIWECVLENMSDKMKAAVEKLKDMREKKKIAKDKFTVEVFEGLTDKTTSVALSKFDKSVDMKGGLRIVGPKLLIFTHLSPEAMRIFTMYLYTSKNLELETPDIAIELYLTAFHTGLPNLQEAMLNTMVRFGSSGSEDFVKRISAEAKKIGDKALKEAYKDWWQTQDPDFYGEKFRKVMDKVWAW